MRRFWQAYNILKNNDYEYCANHCKIFLNLLKLDEIIQKNQSGISILSTLISSAAVAGVILGSMHIIDNHNKAASKIVKRDEKEEIRDFIRKTIDCDETIKAEKTVCEEDPDGKEIRAYDENSNPVITASNVLEGKQLGDQVLSIYCWKHPSFNIYHINAKIRGANERASDKPFLFNLPITCKSTAECSATASWPDPATLAPVPVGSGGAWALTNRVRSISSVCYPSSPAPIENIRRTYGGTHTHHNRWPVASQGTEDLVTLTYVCNLIGYENYVSSDCHDGERSGRYPSGKCNFNNPTPGSNIFTYWDGAAWIQIHSGLPGESRHSFKYGYTWLTSITCSGKK